MPGSRWKPSENTMTYKIVITENADQTLESCVQYLAANLKNSQAAGRLLDEIENIYKKLEDNPWQFGECKNGFLSKMGYRKADCNEMNYTLIFRVEEDSVYILGIMDPSANSGRPSHPF